MQQADAFVFVCDLTNMNSLKYVRELLVDAERAKDGSKLCMILVGNKLDRKSDRQVMDGDLKRFAQEHMNNCAIYEVSAKENVGIDGIFEAIVRELRGGKLPKATLAPAPVQAKPRRRSFLSSHSEGGDSLDAMFDKKK